VEIKRLTVKGAVGIEYPVFIGRGLLEETLLEFVAGQDTTGAAIISNETVAPLYGHALQARIPGSFLVVVADGEQHKTLATVQAIYEALLEHGANRATPVIALGGGVIGDMAGFVAATFMRGVPLVQVPTSLLAMVDASIGSKVGIDLPQGKNLVGAFKDPAAVFADTDTLRTLPEIERSCGLAEIVKAGLVGDPLLFEELGNISPGNTQGYEAIIERAVAVKIAIVEQDRLEGGVRAYLNLGHTFGHALETASNYEWKHGHAVAVGLVAAARLSARLGLCDGVVIGEIERVLKRFSLPCRYKGYFPDAVWEAMRHDKKWRHGVPHFVLLADKGKPVIRNDVPREETLAVLAELREA
jgi:3-dehydroquinate synthase